MCNNLFLRRSAHGPTAVQERWIRRHVNAIVLPSLHVHLVSYQYKVPTACVLVKKEPHHNVQQVYIWIVVTAIVQVNLPVLMEALPHGVAQHLVQLSPTVHIVLSSINANVSKNMCASVHRES